MIVNTFSLDKIYDLREQDFYEVDRYHQKNFFINKSKNSVQFFFFEMKIKLSSIVYDDQNFISP